MKQSIGRLSWLAQYCYTRTTKTVSTSIVTCFNDEGHNGEVLKIKMIKNKNKVLYWTILL